MSSSAGWIVDRGSPDGNSEGKVTPSIPKTPPNSENGPDLGRSNADFNTLEDSEPLFTPFKQIIYEILGLLIANYNETFDGLKKMNELITNLAETTNIQNCSGDNQSSQYAHSEQLPKTWYEAVSDFFKLLPNIKVAEDAGERNKLVELSKKVLSLANKIIELGNEEIAIAYEKIQQRRYSKKKIEESLLIKCLKKKKRK